MKYTSSQKGLIREMDVTELTELLTTLKDQKLIEYAMKQLKQLTGKIKTS
jgi:ribosomal protein L29